MVSRSRSSSPTAVISCDLAWSRAGDRPQLGQGRPAPRQRVRAQRPCDSHTLAAASETSFELPAPYVGDEIFVATNWTRCNPPKSDFVTVGNALGGLPGVKANPLYPLDVTYSYTEGCMDPPTLEETVDAMEDVVKLYSKFQDMDTIMAKEIRKISATLK